MKRKWTRPLAALTALGIVLTLPLNSRAVTALDEEKSCSLTIDFVNEKSEAADSYAKAWGLDLENLTGNPEKNIECNLVIDVYQIGEAKKIAGYDSYTIVIKDEFAGYLEENVKDSGILAKDGESVIIDGNVETLAPGTMGIDLDDLESAKASVWQGLAQAAARYVLEENPVKPTRVIQVGDVADDLGQGLYLLIPRGDGKGQTAYYGEEKYSEYKVAEGNESFRYANAVNAAEEGEDPRLVTYAYTEKYVYTFEPQLVSLPNKTGSGSIDGGAGVSGTEVNTADQSAWEYDLQVYLKPGRELRYGNLKIVKNLELYETLDPSVWAPDEDEEPGEDTDLEEAVPGTPEDVDEGENSVTADAAAGIPTEEKATFAFQVHAVWQNAEGEWITVYNDVKSLTFNGHGTDEILIEHIPAGSRVTVTEVYTGASYEFVSQSYADTDGDPDHFTIFAEDWIAKRESQDVQDNDWITATFTNRYDETRINGYGVTNHFDYDETNGWQWRKLADDSTLTDDITAEGN